MAAALATSAVLALASAPARADQAPAFTAGPVITGQAVVGAPMQVVAQWSGQPTPTPLYEWERCDAAGVSCEAVPGACAATYLPVFDDFAHSLVARVALWNAAGAVVARTPLSDLVLGSVAPPAGGSASAPTSSCATSVTPPPAASPPPATPPPRPMASRIEGPAYMRPFPVVRIRGYLERGGTRITLLSVRGPRSARIRATCAGAGCPRGAEPPALVPPIRLRTFERFLPAGTVLRIRVTSATAIGKYTSFRIAARRAPRRADRCLVPGRWAPGPCPAP